MPLYKYRIIGHVKAESSARGYFILGRTNNPIHAIAIAQKAQKEQPYLEVVITPPTGLNVKHN